MLDVATCAMAFRLLRMNGYDVSSGTFFGREFPILQMLSLYFFCMFNLTHQFQYNADDLYHVDASTFHNSLQGYLNDTKSILELYKASKVSLSENKFSLDNIGYCGY